MLYCVSTGNSHMRPKTRRILRPFLAHLHLSPSLRNIQPASNCSEIRFENNTDSKEQILFSLHYKCGLIDQFPVLLRAGGSQRFELETLYAHFKIRIVQF